MSINYKLIVEAIQAVTELGKTVESLEYAVQALEQDVNHWRNTANALERKLESAEKACANEADRCDEIEAKLAETLKVNENLRVARNEECTKYDKVCGELTETIEQLEAATELNNSLRNTIKELESQVQAK